MADITFVATPGDTMEGIAITSGADSGATTLVVSFSTTSVFTSKEAVVNALELVIARVEASDFPPAAFTP